MIRVTCSHCGVKLNAKDDDAERQLEPEPDVDQHSDEREPDRRLGLVLEIGADCGPDALGAEQGELAEGRRLLDVGADALGDALDGVELVEAGIVVAAAERVGDRAAAGGEALLELGSTHPDVVVLDADLSGSTKTKAFGSL